MAEKPKYETHTTPRGTLGYSHFAEPDTKFAKPGEKGVYKSDVTVDAVKFGPLKAKIDAEVDAKFEKQKAELASKGQHAKVKKLTKVYPYEMVLDADGEETGKVKIKTKANAEFTSRKTGKTHSNKPAVFGKNGQPFQGQVFAGSTAALSVEFNPYYMESSVEVGCSLRLKAAMIYEAVAANQASASKYGFETEEDDEDREPVEDDAADTETPAADDDDEF